ncbi:MAG: T9SS type A sorting domain-containing protein [Brumimicrobium sp.]|nr:T9SS type A sorting domain-containing protein [Brumimicrobium sp.]
MKHIYSLVLGLCLSIGLTNAQTFTDNFDTYTAGAYLAQQSSAWTTWGNAPGTTEDVKVSNADSHSSPNSIYLSSNSANGGPTDLVKQFGGTYQTGNFNLEMWMKIESNKGAYFNIQGKAPIGDMFVFEYYWNSDGTFEISNTTDGTLLAGTYPTGTWFKFNLNIDLTINDWEVLIDGTSKGSFSVADNQVWGMDIFPYNSVAPNQAGYYIDDFTYTYTPFVPLAKDLAVTKYNINGVIAGSKHNSSVTVRNIGNSAITSFDLATSYNGMNFNKSVTGVNIATMAEYTVTFTDSLVLATTTEPYSATISNVNGAGADDNTANDTKNWMVTTITPAFGKVVAVEEGTGTWCTWCPRGAVFMDEFSKKYAGAIAPIAVHNGDPMVVPAYDTGMGFTSFPNAKVDRGAGKDPSAIESDIMTRLSVAPKAVLTPGAEWNATTRELKVSITSDIIANITNGYKISLVIAEDGVTGTTSGYAQINSYAGGSNGVMGGYESLPNPVPASMMVYDHVARTILPSFAGDANSYPSGANAGESHVLSFTLTLPAEWNENKIHIIGLLKAPNNRIENAGTATLSEAIANGFNDGTPASVESNIMEQVDAAVKIYPNPAQNFTNIVLNLKGQQNVQVDLVDMTGKVIGSRDYGMLDGGQQITLPTLGLDAGIYLVNVRINNQLVSKRLIVE